MRALISPLAPTLAIITTVVLAGCSDDASPGLTDPVNAPDWLSMSVGPVTTEALHVFQAPDAQAGARFGLELPRGIDQSLSGPLNAALASLENDRPATIQQLEAFIRQVEALRDRQLTDEEADALIAAAKAIIAALENG